MLESSSPTIFVEIELNNDQLLAPPFELPWLSSSYVAVSHVYLTLVTYAMSGRTLP
jgi:hypothetical protein